MAVIVPLGVVFAIFIVTAKVATNCNTRLGNESQSLKDELGASQLFLLADQLRGKPWPLPASTQMFDICSDQWLVLVLRDNCDHCRSLLAKLDDEADAISDWQIAIFVIGRSTGNLYVGKTKISERADFVFNWTSSREPFVASPAIFVLENGFVIQAADGSEAEQLLEQIVSANSSFRVP